MKEIKRLTLRFFLGAEIILLTLFYLLGNGGLEAVKIADLQNKALLTEIQLIESEIGVLSRELDDRKTNPFYKESIARKELQMAYENEMIYLIPRE